MNWNPSLSIKTALQLLFLALMESAWIVGLGALLSSLNMPESQTFPLSSQAVVGLWVAGAVPLALLGRSRPLLARLLAVAAGLAVVYTELATRFSEANPLTFLAKMPPNLLVMIAVVGAFGWGRGLLAGIQSATGLSELMGVPLFARFRLGLLLLGMIVISTLALDIAQSDTLIGRQIGGLILSFLVFALINLAWGNLEETTLETANRAQQSSRPRPLTWLLGLGTILVAVLIMGGVLGGAGNSPLGTLLGIISIIALVVLGGITFVLGILGGIFVPVVQFVLGGVRNFGNPFSPHNAPQHKGIGALADLFKSVQDAANEGEMARLVSFWIAVIILIILAVWLFAFLGVRRLLAEPKSPRAADTMRVSFGSWGLFWRQLRTWLAALWLALLRRLGLIAAPLLVGVGEVSQWSGADGQRLVSIRQIYRRFQKVAARAGQPRRAPATPREYLAQLQEAYTDLPAGAAALTLTYTAARYGNVAPTEQQVSAANAALVEVEQFFAARRAGVQPTNS